MKCEDCREDCGTYETCATCETARLLSDGNFVDISKSNKRYRITSDEVLTYNFLRAAWEIIHRDPIM